MEITYTNTIEDQKSYFDFLLMSKEYGKKARLSIFLVLQTVVLFTTFVMGLLALILSFGSWTDLGMTIIASFVIAEIVIILRGKFRPTRTFGHSMIDKRFKKLSEKDKEIFFLPKTLASNASGIEAKTSAASHFWTWDTVDDIFLLENLVAVKIGDSNQHLIPKRAFDSENDFLAFGKQLLKYKENAQH